METLTPLESAAPSATTWWASDYPQGSVIPWNVREEQAKRLALLAKTSPEAWLHYVTQSGVPVAPIATSETSESEAELENHSDPTSIWRECKGVHDIDRPFWVAYAEPLPSSFTPRLASSSSQPSGYPCWNFDLPFHARQTASEPFGGSTTEESEGKGVPTGSGHSLAACAARSCKVPIRDRGFASRSHLSTLSKWQRSTSSSLSFLWKYISPWCCRSYRLTWRRFSIIRSRFCLFASYNL
jgi:hypothetical protein